MAAAVATLRESDRPACGMKTRASADLSHSVPRPSFSEPMTIATEPLASTSQSGCAPSGVVASVRTFFSLSQAMVSADEATATGMEKAAPCEARITLGLKRSVTGSQTSKASQPAESAVRRSAPRLPGFSTASTTSNSGLGPMAKRASPQSQVSATAIKPSGPSRPLTFSKAESPSSQQGMPASRARVIRSTAPGARKSAGQK